MGEYIAYAWNTGNRDALSFILELLCATLLFFFFSILPSSLYFPSFLILLLMKQ